MDRNRVKGPFYVGISQTLKVPEFYMRLRGPTSTSRYVEPAIGFSGDDGIVIQLNNSGDKYASKLRSFNCGWLSHFPSEGEHLFIGGYHRLKLEAIIVVATRQNFKTFIHAMGDLMVLSVELMLVRWRNLILLHRIALFYHNLLIIN